MQLIKACPNCEGTGWRGLSTPCWDCNGTRTGPPTGEDELRDFVNQCIAEYLKANCTCEPRHGKHESSDCGLCGGPHCEQCGRCRYDANCNCAAKGEWENA